MRDVSEALLPRTVRRPASAEMMLLRPEELSLQITHPDRAPRCEALTRERIGCGRAATNDVVIDDPSLSARHFWLDLDRTGIRLFDSGSTNGTWLHGARICEAWLQPGARFSAGDHRFEILCIDTPAIPIASGSSDGLQEDLGLPLPLAIERLERAYLERVLRRTRGNLSAAARLAGVSRKGLRQRLQRLGMYRGPAQR